MKNNKGEASLLGFKACHGSTMIEALVTIVLISVGMLSLSLLQTISMRSNKNAHFTSIAMIQAEDVIERMRVNPKGLEVATNYTNMADKDPGCMTSLNGCIPSEMAKYDTFTWNKVNEDLLPGGTGSITKNGDIFTIVLSWATTDSSNNNCPGNIVTTNNNCFITTFHP